MLEWLVQGCIWDSGISERVADSPSLSCSALMLWIIFLIILQHLLVNKLLVQ